jgi:hypothetical protein
MNHGPSSIDDVAERNKGIGVWDVQTCEPELPHDTAEDVFLDARCRIKLPLQLVPFKELLDWWSLKVFQEFWKDYEDQEGGSHSSRSFGDEAAIRLLQVLTNSHNRKTAMKAECFLAVINRKTESQTEIAKKYGVTRAAVSKVIVSIKDELNLPTARHMKSESARESYRVRALFVHAKRKKNICNTSMNPFNKFWNSMSSNLNPPMPAPSR